MTIVVATSGDTGPAAAYACMGKENLDIWVLYPKGLITEEQERQMTTLSSSNVFAVGVDNCPDGSDDLDNMIRALYADKALKEELNLSSVNSINWGRVMMQTVHYFFGYLQSVDRVGDLMNFAVPSGAFGNLCAGGLAREMGLPVEQFIVSNNENACLSRVFSEGVFCKEEVIPTPSSAIDISVPINFWRYLYFAIGQQPDKIKAWYQEFAEKGVVCFSKTTQQQYSQGFLTAIISAEETLRTIRAVYENEDYLLDPHGAVAVAAASRLQDVVEHKILCLATAHPSKFPEVIQQALEESKALPAQATHAAIEQAKDLCQRIYSCDFAEMYEAIPNTMRKHWKHIDS